MATVDPKVAIDKKYKLAHSQLIRVRDADLRKLQADKTRAAQDLEHKLQGDQRARTDQFREDSLALNAQEKDELDALNP